MLTTYQIYDTVEIDWQKQQWQQKDFVLFLDNTCNIEFIETSKTPHSLAYQHTVNQHWDKQITLKQGKLWNNQVLSITKISLLNQKLSVYYTYTEYKDILYKQQVGLNFLRHHFPNDIENHSFTAILPQLEYQYLWGVVGNGTIQAEGLIDIIGGSVEFEPNFSWQKLQQKTCAELREETNLVIAPNNITNFTLNYFDGCVFFLFKTPLIKAQFESLQVDKLELKQVITAEPNELLTGSYILSKDTQFILKYLL